MTHKLKYRFRSEVVDLMVVCENETQDVSIHNFFMSVWNNNTRDSNIIFSFREVSCLNCGHIFFEIKDINPISAMIQTIWRMGGWDAVKEFIRIKIET